MPSIKSILRAISCTFMMILVIPAKLFAADWYVSPSGQDWYSGDSQANPFKNISKGIQVAQAGDTIFVMDGTYRNSNFNYSKILGTNPNYLNNNNVVTINKSGNAVDGPITLRNLPGHSPVIEFDGAGGIKLNADVDYIVIEGFEVIGPAQYISYEQAIANRDSAYNNGDPDNGTNYNYFSGRGIYGFGPHNNIVIRNNVVHDTAGSGIRLNDADRSTIEFNRVYNATWWTHSASSAIVFAEAIAEAGDNGSEIKMVMRGNVVYDSWNRIPFYSRTSVPNGNGPGGDYGTYAQNTVIDGQGLYVTRSDPSYAGTFLFENNIVFNCGKNGIHFDHSDSAHGIIRNNTLYHNGSHNIIQLQEHGQLLHNGPNKVAGINSRNTASVKVTNNIVVTRDDQYTAIGLYNIPDTIVKNNLFVNGSLVGTTPLDPTNMLNIDPQFINPSTDYLTADFNLALSSPLRNAGHLVYAATKDFNDVFRPLGIAASTFESHTSGWDSFGDASTQISVATGIAGSNSLFVNNRTAAWHGAKFDLTGLSLVDGQQYNFVVNAKLATATPGTVQLSMKVGESFSNLTNALSANNNDWTELSGSFTYSENDPVHVYVKGPTDLSSYYIDNAVISIPGSNPINFDDLVELGVFEYRILVDTDSDSIEDQQDNCPNIANQDQTDTDGDGVGDVCDDDAEGDGVIDLDFVLIPDDKNNDGVINNQDNVFGQNQFLISNSTGNYTLTITATDTNGAPAKLSRQAAADGKIYGLGVKPDGNSNTDRKINVGETVVFSVSDSNGPVNASNFSFVTSDVFTMNENEFADLVIDGNTYNVKGGPQGAVINGSSNVANGSSSWSTVSSSSFSLTPTTGDFRLIGVSLDINTTSSEDSDGDGILDYVDNCPSVANGPGESNQSDIDGDQLGDVCDDDIDGDGVLNVSDAFPNDGSESADSDSDLIGDNSDNCLNDSNNNQSDIDSDGVGDVCDDDTDGDGVSNALELSLGFNPNDPSDGSAAALAVLEAINENDEVVIVPMIGMFGYFALGLSLLGLGYFRSRQRYIR
jgi:hypothetical protein